MERRTTRLASALRTRAGRWALVLGAALVGCSSAALLYQSEAPATDVRPPNVTSTASASPKSAEPAAVALDEFTPLLADVRFQSVADALTAEDVRAAALALQAVLDSDKAARTPTLELWSSRLWERAGDLNRMLAACDRARAGKFLLSEYAELCAARALHGLGRSREVVERLAGKTFVDPLESERRLLEARAARGSGDPARAIRAFRSALALKLKPTDAARMTLELAELLLETTAPRTPAAVEPLTLIRRAGATLASSKSDRARTEELERRALGRLSPADLAENVLPSLEQRLAKVAGLLESREYVLTDRAATELSSSLAKKDLHGPVGCEALVLRAKALAALREYASAVEALADGRQHCAGDFDRGARIFYLSGRYAASEGRWVHSTAFFTELEKRYQGHTLTDDARYYAAIAQQELGVESRFTELLLSLPDDYPTGDMTAEGLFRLALRRMERGAWSEALGLLERGVTHVGALDRERGLDLAGRERYFKARALLALGDRAGALAELSLVVERHPLSYYMVQAYSLLERLEPGRGHAELERAASKAASEPFRIAGRTELERPGFLRMMELLRIGELDGAVRELDTLGLRGEGTGSEILWGIAMLYERAGFSKFSADLAKRQLSEVVSRWPVGGWERAWQIAFPRPHFEIVRRESSSTGVDPALVYAVMREESAFDAEVVSTANAYGLMQLIEPTARMLAKGANLPSSPEALKRPRVNVALGCRMLSRLAVNFEQNPLLAIPAYNAGPGRARRWIRERPRTEFDLWVELIPYAETRKYTKRVLSSRAVYAFLYEREKARANLLLPLLAGSPAEPKR